MKVTTKRTKRAKHADTQQLDMKIARLLLQNPTMSHREIGLELAHSEGAIRQRRTSMQKRGILLWSTAIWDWEAIGLPLKFRIDIQINQNALLSKGGGGPVNLHKILGTQEALSNFIRTELISYVSSSSRSDHRLSNLQEQLFVEDVIILLGNPTADICAIVRARNNLAILKFVTSGLRMMRAIARTSTYQEAWSSREGSVS